MGETTFEILSSREEPAALRLRAWRTIKDRLMRYFMVLGGVSVIIAIVLIFFYLLYVVIPLFRPAEVRHVATYPVPGGNQAETLVLATEEYSEIGLRITSDARAFFFETQNGKVLSDQRLAIGASVPVTSAATGDPSEAAIALGLSDGSALLFKHSYTVGYPNDIRAISSQLLFPLGQAPLKVDDQGSALKRLTVQSNDEEATIVAVTADDRVVMANFEREESLIDDEVTVERNTTRLPVAGDMVTHIALNVEQRDLYIATRDGSISYYKVADKSEPRLIDRVSVVSEGKRVTALRFLSGGISILVGDSDGRIAQWFPVRDKQNKYTLSRVRDFTAQHSAITDITPEYFRKGFASIDISGQLGIYHTTAQRTLLVQSIADQPLVKATIAPRANAILLLDKAGQLNFFEIHNEHPEVSWSSLWGKVWYENRRQPEYIWQSSSASSDFEPKFSLTPLAFGTIKAALYAMLFAVPLAILGAVFTAYFMSPKMRAMVKPTIEVMEALPTVILGFLAGLWLAPMVEKNLPGVLGLLVFLPLAMVLAAYAWHCLPGRIRHMLPDGWEAALLVPIVILTGVFAMWIGQPFEALLFDGDMPGWLTREMGLNFDQRNSLVVGLAMGFAVIPTIFSISEDAIFSVPKHLTLGSLALGATPWQTMLRVVLLTASPGIFSAIMIGLGRAVGETMIVLMATGNTPIMDLNIFQGFRALSANIAVEMPESEVNSTHYRILFLAALVLFMATFVFNTLAELIRQRLREKYSSL